VKRRPHREPWTPAALQESLKPLEQRNHSLCQWLRREQKQARYLQVRAQLCSVAAFELLDVQAGIERPTLSPVVRLLLPKQ
jgi:hypothetical protein